MKFPARIVHDEHGATHVYNYAEWQAHEARGWKVEKLEPEPERKKPGPKPKAA